MLILRIMVLFPVLFCLTPAFKIVNEQLDNTWKYSLYAFMIAFEIWAIIVIAKSALLKKQVKNEEQK
ncbi:hypothetical protein IT568_05205 [bacterium]|nr:hypothetical protein [bacterium]